MLFLLFQAGEHRYAIDVSHTIEVLPLVHWKPIPGTPAAVAGLFNYHGTPVPLIDLSKLITQQEARPRMSTRIIVVNRDAKSGHGTRLLGLLAEQVTETLRQPEEEFRHSGLACGNAPYLGRIAVQSLGMIQRIEIENLLPPDVEHQLGFGEVVTASADC